VVLVEAPLDAEQTIADASDGSTTLSRLARRDWLGTSLFNGDGDLVLKLDAVTESIIEVEVGNLIGTGRGIAITDPAEVDLPMFIAWSFGVVGAKWRTALGVSCNGRREWEGRRRLRRLRGSNGASIPSSARAFECRSNKVHLKSNISAL